MLKQCSGIEATFLGKGERRDEKKGFKKKRH
jgi:hypothetical protein